MSNVWCVRANYGSYTKAFIDGGYAAIGWMDQMNLSGIRAKEELYPLYQQAHPADTSNLVIGQQVGQIARFLLEIQEGDYVITPDMDTEWLHYGQVAADPSYYFSSVEDGCPFPHRRRVVWAQNRLRRSDFSVPFQNTIRATLTVFYVSQRDEFLTAIGRTDLTPKSAVPEYDPYRIVLEQILLLNDKEFEILVGHLLSALGFDGSEVVGKTGDGGIDVTGELNVAGLAKMKLVVQAKRFKLGIKVPARTVREFRQAIRNDSQGAFITTADFQEKAAEYATEPGFPRIGLIHGRQLVDLLVEHWDDIPFEFRERLGLKTGLVKA